MYAPSSVALQYFTHVVGDLDEALDVLGLGMPRQSG